VVHYSTDFVFSGRSNRPYREDDEPEPTNVYGQTKLAGERALLSADVDALVFRTAWVYGVRGRNFLLTMLSLFRERTELGIVDDQIGTPTWARMLAEVTAQILYRVFAGELRIADVRGLYHVTGGGAASWFGFAQAIRDASGSRCELKPIPTSEYPAPARRPAYSVLDTAKFRDTFGLALPDWRQSLDLCLADLHRSA
jgi:dTDP-4-dehydrorhamnose reductase